MILGFELTLFAYIMLASLFRLFRNLGHEPALFMLILCSSVLLSLINPVLATYLCGQIVWVFVLYGACRRWPDKASVIAWLAFLGLLPLNIEIWFGDTFTTAKSFGMMGETESYAVFWTAGAGFFVIKSFVSLKEAIRLGKFAVLPTLAGLTFLPAFTAGPIFGSGPFLPENIQQRLNFRSLALSWMQLGWGAAAFYVIAPALREVATENSENLLGEIGNMYLNFAALFFDFSGYTLMALAIAAFFGVTLPQNFNRPYLATSIREFWQRWHMSLSWFISTYLFKPFVRRTGSAQKGIFLAFVCVGLWHEVKIGYLLWGIGHGAALSLAMKPPRMWKKLLQTAPNWVGKALGWFLTMTWVALLSGLANAEFLR